MPPVLTSHILTGLALVVVCLAACASSLDDLADLDAGEDSPATSDAADAGPEDAVEDPADDPTADAPDPTDDPVPDAEPDVADVNINPGPDAGGGPLTESGDWADCFEEAECPGHDFATGGLTVTLDPTTGSLERDGQRFDWLSGRIEAVGTHPFGYDADLIAVRAPARTLVIITVEPAGASSSLDPYVTTVDLGRPGEEFRFQEITSNDDRDQDDPAARTMIAVPFDDAPFYVWIDDARNVSGTDLVGGDTFTYFVSFEVSAFSPAEIDVSDGSGVLSGIDLAFAGDVHFYTFRPAVDGDWRVTMTTANTDFLGYLIGFDTRGGRLQPLSYAGDPNWADTRELGPEAFAVDARNEYVFAVTDWLGRGSNTSDSLFFYDVAVAAE